MCALSPHGRSTGGAGLSPKHERPGVTVCPVNETFLYSHSTDFLCTLRFFSLCFLLNRFLFQEVVSFLSLEKHLSQNILLTQNVHFFPSRWQAFVSSHCVASC